jgi:hypothetical protein
VFLESPKLLSFHWSTSQCFWSLPSSSHSFKAPPSASGAFQAPLIPLSAFVTSQGSGQIVAEQFRLLLLFYIHRQYHNCFLWKNCFLAA